MVRRHSFNRRVQQDLKESIKGQGEVNNVKSKVRMTHLWRIYVAATSGVCVGGLDLVGIADVKNARDIDDVLSFTDHTLANISRKSPPSYLEATTGLDNRLLVVIGLTFVTEIWIGKTLVGVGIKSGLILTMMVILSAIGKITNISNIFFVGFWRVRTFGGPDLNVKRKKYEELFYKKFITQKLGFRNLAKNSWLRLEFEIMEKPEFSRKIKKEIFDGIIEKHEHFFNL
ncbi:hypothetical protein GLOIN_2v1785936 [Rhizophagus irregularis DAOM 181602=DAOM 197198]|uniref:Uncharacterized protein n=1 Tax=Rhizophagus irregularis (strain DAOM 181602 / DAOM 197198 / MUCL 43194) TaxID=747089 RepID=A0A2P4P983_RHIID|nr:hypothetical protein GLOIN_2v1785936 [Rhizophagus irregularis DAOM 181602=DAOM 197198]POG61949.1 hypothetical protein GLOIN_2v1785936 [Rhizophagus irregularis DAOM 181602=DAOM 197198]GBC18451.2 hypothetical protein GLOIN_2v1785936 [Rhizophagus irregularis DAOM 181602=DAOM 197198]|eukprot:XP_025168815.1 hypothetical protein GLOIN_2v1785936 [Rhizophagus irregularis DAOM 181602=DAOM 197198]